MAIVGGFVNLALQEEEEATLLNMQEDKGCLAICKGG
jgi:hypothetical protein